MAIWSVRRYALVVYMEGGGNTILNNKLRESLRSLLIRLGFENNLPRIVPCGSRSETFNKFRIALDAFNRNVYLLVDSEDIVNDVEKTWEHLKNRRGDKWDKPNGANDEHVFLMTTCMETWIVADVNNLKTCFGNCIKESKLPKQDNLESVNREEVQKSLANATEKCPTPLVKDTKGYAARTYELLSSVNPNELKEKLPSFARMVRILNQRLLRHD